jgi:hypothetical protein
LKSTDGDSDDPLVTLTLNKNGVGGLRLWSGTASNFTVARNFTYTTNAWNHADILITTSLGNTGSVTASVNGDAFSGLSNLPVFRPSATDYRPKWGFYRAINTSMFVGTNWIEDRNVTAGPAIPGDFNNNGIVDAADYVVWRNGLGTTYTQTDYNAWRTHFGSTSTPSAAYGNGNGTIDAADYALSRNRLGQSAGGGAFIAEPVPEPATLILLLVTPPCGAFARLRIQSRCTQNPKPPLAV